MNDEFTQQTPNPLTQAYHTALRQGMIPGLCTYQPGAQAQQQTRARCMIMSSTRLKAASSPIPTAGSTAPNWQYCTPQQEQQYQVLFVSTRSMIPVPDVALALRPHLHHHRSRRLDQNHEHDVTKRANRVDDPTQDNLQYNRMPSSDDWRPPIGKFDYRLT
jgi:hypothetical protein